MNLPNYETSHLCAVLQHVVLDLRDRGDIPISACDTLMCRLAEGDQVFDDLSLFGKALDAFLLNDETVSRDAHQRRLEELYLRASPVFGQQFTDMIVFGEPENLAPSIIRALRDLSYLYYKYEAPYEKALVQTHIDKFVEVDKGLAPVDCSVDSDAALMERLFRHVDLADITPTHGPGSVADKATGGFKYDWSSFPERLSNIYSYDYFVASFSHLAESLRDFTASKNDELYARLLTVPKDSRGPRVISCEPKEFQWIQQGIRAKLYDWIERHSLTKGAVRFRDQTVNGRLALEGSASREWATLDLSEASDRVSLDYVTRVFPEKVRTPMLSCRSNGTVLPDGTLLMLQKFAPMGSALCFPVLALTIWARLRSAGVKECHVYGDDVIVPRTKVSQAITALSSIGLKVNESKSCYTGLFRESCGVDAYNGVDVTPVRIRTRWRNHRHPSVYVSWVSYANSLYMHGYVRAANFIAAEMGRIYGPIPQSEHEELNVPSFRFNVPGQPQPKRRTKQATQSLQLRVWTVRPLRTKFAHNGWYKLLNWFSKQSNALEAVGAKPCPFGIVRDTDRCLEKRGMSASWYTERDRVTFAQQWVDVYPVVAVQ